ncbi:hypothetical protein [Leptospira broomii]|nr:hypothetical protein [Leptospira broomii]
MKNLLELNKLLKEKDGTLTHVQSTFVLIRFGIAPYGPAYKIHFKGKIDFTVRRAVKVKRIDFYDEHLINLERREECFELYFIADDRESFISLRNHFDDCVYKIFGGCRSPDYFLNTYLREIQVKNEGAVSGLLCSAPKSIIDLLEMRFDPRVKLSKISIGKREPVGIVAFLDEMFVWAREFRIEKTE